MAIMFGNGTVREYASATATAGDSKYIMRTEEFLAEASGSAVAAGWKANYEGPNGKLHAKINPKFYVIEISAASFPGTYYVTGDTYARSEASGKDEFFQFIIPKAKMNAENTITLEAEGDPSVFNMSLRVMRPADGVMMKLVKYDLIESGEADQAALELIHNHTLNPATNG